MLEFHQNLKLFMDNLVKNWQLANILDIAAIGNSLFTIGLPKICAALPEPVLVPLRVTIKQ